jgi:hypothetical protein
MNGCSELDGIQTRNRIVPLLIIGFAFLLSCGCKHASAPPSAPAAKPAPIEKPTAKKDVPGDQKLAHDFIAAGFTPPKVPGKEITKNTKIVDVIDGVKSITFANGAFSVNSQVRLEHLLIYVSAQGSPDSKLPLIKIKSYNGGDFLSLSKSEFLKLYGNPNRSVKTAELKGRYFRYEYRLDAQTIVAIMIGFSGKGNGATMKSISGDVTYGDLAKQIFGLDPNAKYFTWPGGV